MVICLTFSCSIVITKGLHGEVRSRLTTMLTQLQVTNGSLQSGVIRKPENFTSNGMIPGKTLQHIKQVYGQHILLMVDRHLPQTKGFRMRHGHIHVQPAVLTKTVTAVTMML